MTSQFLHIHKKQEKNSFYILLLIIPAIIFALSLAFISKKINKISSLSLDSKSVTDVLGETTNQP